MLKKIYVPLETDEWDALRKLSNDEKRRVNFQAAVLIRDELIRLGYLKEKKESSDDPRR